MAKSDYYRPSQAQIRQVAECSHCRRHSEYDSQQNLDNARCACGGLLVVIGESYPASADDWDEERDTRDGEWHRRRY